MSSFFFINVAPLHSPSSNLSLFYPFSHITAALCFSILIPTPMRKSRFSKLQKFDTVLSFTKQRSVQVLIAVALLYVFLVTLEIPLVFRAGLNTVPFTRRQTLATELKLHQKHAPTRPVNWVSKNAPAPTPTQFTHATNNRSSPFLSRLPFHANTFDPSRRDHSVELHRAAKAAWEDGTKLWTDLHSVLHTFEPVIEPERNRSQPCPDSLSISGSQFVDRGEVMLLPCGLTLGSHITVVGKPKAAHAEKDPKISILRQGFDSMMVSQFMMELQGLRAVEGEEPPRILHLNPRLKGDWSGKSVIEINTCYRMQWGSALRCDGWRSNPQEETVDGQVKCEKWSQDDDRQMKSSKANWWLKRLVGRHQKVNVDWWSYPFAEEKIFVLTLSAGFEGYHINVDGRHVTSFPYRTGFTLEDATGLTLKGDVDVQSIFAASLPMSHPSFASQRHLDMSDKWKAPNLPEQPVQLFIGILSAGNHFSERMAVRKSWMQHKLVKSSKVVARFFVALHARKEVNEELKKEAEFFGDVVIVPYMDNYDLVVLKTVAICEYGSRQVLAKYIMKCDDDTFIRVDAVINEVKKVPEEKSFYMGNINYYHKPLRYGKWAVTYEEWPEEDYPPYANGPGYIMSSDIGGFIVSEFEQHKLQLFKMEDVSVGMWVGKFNSSKPVDYLHSLMFCQYGCFEGYYTAHYQSPRQMMCLWDRLQREGKPHCCDMR